MEEKRKILYVDDEPINLKLFEINLSRRYEVITCTGGYEGLDALEKHKDLMLVLTDLKMPGMNGFDFISKVKKSYPEKTCYLLTGFDITEEIQAALKNGMIKKYFGKPFDFKEIEKTLEMEIGKMAN